MINKKMILDTITKDILEIRLHGRGGQGVVIASKILAKAFHQDGYIPQTFPKYGVERRGAPAAAFVRVAKGKNLIGIRCEIYEPDHLIILDPTLISAINITQGLKKGGWIIINASAGHEADFSELQRHYRVAIVDASKVAFEHRLGSRTSPVVNSAILGGFAKVYQKPSISSILEAIRNEVPIKPDENAAAANMAYDQIKVIGD
ncbi:2-oxoacid:acceptor oxidoreductase family protein [candidate division CSSED10-310 bacterium]|uniref:2-oxoacid:acceptor oxidoreductase family protein n=1 Tax=candidate division CSSED10-310 bacterium TaxID=2855610 RepID=A0ABV6YV56_UNCC1